jgi:hypothetical protein
VSVTPLRQQALIRAAGGRPRMLRGVAAVSPDTKEILKLPYSA